MGIHSGQAAASEEKYLGLAVHRAARISASGHGGQILVSQTTQNLLEDEEETSGVELRDLGEQRLKDLDRPVHVYQVAAEGLVRDFPPLRTDAPSPEVEPARRYPRRRTILAGALAGVIAAAVAVPIFAFGGGSGGGGLGGATGNAIGSIDAESGDVEAGVELPGAPSAVGLGSVWAVSGDKNQVYAIDLDTTNVDRIDVGNAPGSRSAVGSSGSRTASTAPSRRSVRKGKSSTTSKSGTAPPASLLTKNVATCGWLTRAITRLRRSTRAPESC
jgi:hypothetical protein